MANKNAKTDHLKKTQIQNLSTDKQRAIGRKGGKASQKAQKKKKEEKKEKQKFADIFNIILENEINDEIIKKRIKERYPELSPNNKTLIAVEHFTRMFKKITSKTKDGITINKKINNQNFLKYEEFFRDSIGEKPKDDFNFTPVVNIIVDSKKKKDLMSKI